MLKNLILGYSTINTQDIQSFRFQALDILSYIERLSPPLNLKCLSDILTADLSDENDSWGCFLNNNLIDEFTVSLKEFFFSQVKHALKNCTQQYYTHEQSTFISPELLTLLQNPNFITTASNIFHLLGAQSHTEVMPKESRRWLQKYLGFISNNNPKEIIRTFIEAMPEGEKKDFYCSRGMEANFLIGQFLSHKSSFEKLSASRLCLFFNPSRVAPENDRDNYSTLHGESELLGMIR